jgi:hypothetical protein
VGKREELFQVLDFILNRSGMRDVEVIQEALKRRIRDLNQRLVSIDVPDVAHQLSEMIQKEMSSVGGFYERIREYMKQIILQHRPDMPEKHIELLLAEWTPDSKWGEKGREHNFPPDAVFSMIVQFVDYSLGRMQESDRQALPDDWSERYWRIFSGHTRKHIADLLTGKIDEELFWRRIESRSDEATVD